MKAKTPSVTTAGYHVILPKLDKKRDSVQDIAKGVGMVSGGRINFQMGAVEVFITMVCGVLGTIFLMSVSKAVVKVKGLNAFLAYVGQNSLTVLILLGAIMRIYCDIFGLTGTPAGSFGLTNLYVFLLTLLTTVLFIYLKGLINNKVKF